MPFDIKIPTSSENAREITLDAGDALFVLGANGSGKSSLMQKLYADHHDNSWWISSHRQTWFMSNAISLSPNQKQKSAVNIKNNDQQVDSRWNDRYSAQRPDIAIFDLVEAENIRARQITSAVDANNMDLASELSKKDAPIKTINRLLHLSNIPIVISVVDSSEVVASKYGSEPFSIARLSDGERNTLLVAASVLTVKSGTLILIDEPERHLHRSIISPLLTLLFAERADCAFIVSTHDVLLPSDNESARVRTH